MYDDYCLFWIVGEYIFFCSVEESITLGYVMWTTILKYNCYTYIWCTNVGTFCKSFGPGCSLKRIFCGVVLLSLSKIFKFLLDLVFTKVDQKSQTQTEKICWCVCV